MSQIGGSVNVYVENVAAVRTNLYAFSEETAAALLEVMRRIATRIATRARTNSLAFRKSGKTERSIRVATVKAWGDNRHGPFAINRVGASVVAGGTRTVRYAHALERGFDGVVQVPAHTRGNMFNPRTTERFYGPKGGGRQTRFHGGFSVKAYDRHHIVKARGFLDAGLQAEAASIAPEVSAVIGSVAERKGLT